MALTTYAELQAAVENWIGDTTINARVLEFITLGEAWIWRNVRVRAVEEMVDLRLEAAQAGGTAAGTANAITVAISGFTGPTLGDTVTFTASATNTSSVTLNVQSTGAIALNKGDGSVALEANDIVNGHDYRAYYDGTRWVLCPRGAIPLPSRCRSIKNLFIDRDPNRPLNFLTTDAFWSRHMSDDVGIPQAYTIMGDFVIFGPAPESSLIARALYYRRPTAISSAVPRLFTENPDLYLYAALLQAAPYLEDDPRAITWAAMLNQILEDMEREDKEDRFTSGPAQTFSNVANLRGI